MTVNISFSRQLLKAMDRVAKEEARNRSDLLREAIRQYIERKTRWNEIFSFGNRHAKRLGLKPSDIEKQIAVYRRERARQAS